MSYKHQYLKYKQKYLNLKNELEGGVSNLEYEDFIKIEKNLEQKQRKVNLEKVKFMQEQERQRRVRQNSDIVERGTDISQLQEKERESRLNTVYLEYSNQLLPIYNSKTLNNMFQDIPSTGINKMKYEDFIKMLPKSFNNINLMDLLITIFEIRKKFSSKNKSSIQTVILTYGVTTILLLITICDFLEIEDIYNDLIIILNRYVKLRYSKNLSLKDISIFEISEVFNNIHFIRNNLNINMNIDFIGKILILKFIPDINILSELYDDMIDGQKKNHNYMIIKIIFDVFVEKILGYKLSNPEQIINYFKSISNINIEKIRFLLQNEIK